MKKSEELIVALPGYTHGGFHVTAHKNSTIENLLVPGAIFPCLMPDGTVQLYVSIPSIDIMIPLLTAGADRLADALRNPGVLPRDMHNKVIVDRTP